MTYQPSFSTCQSHPCRSYNNGTVSLITWGISEFIPFLRVLV